MSTTPVVTSSVVIATHGRSRLLQRTLESLCACDRPAGFQQVAVVENGSHETAEEISSAFSSRLPIRYLNRSIANKSMALNACLEQIESDLLIFLDDDVRVAPHLLVDYSTAAAAAPSSYFGGPLHIDWECEPPQWLRPFLPRSATGWQPDTDRERLHPYFLGANWAAFRADLLSAKGFRTDYGPGLHQAVGEDTRMQLDLQEHSIIPRYVETAIVWHYVPKEACSPEWALHRTYRNAISFGNDYVDDSPLLFGVPRWMLREYGCRAFRALIAKALWRDPAAVHAARADFRTIQGWIHGIRHRPGHRTAMDRHRTILQLPGRGV